MQLAEAARELATIIARRDHVLATQLSSAALSVPSNIAEGYGRSGRGEYLYFLSIASGSLTEVGTHTLIAQRAKLGPEEHIQRVLSLADETGRILHGLRKSLSPKNKKGPKWPARSDAQ
jgi:four helix bundle protein